MSTIVEVIGREVLDTRGNPTVEVEVELLSGARGRAIVPSGASTGAHEAVELRDGGDRYGGKGVLDAVGHVNGEIADLVVGLESTDQRSSTTSWSCSTAPTASRGSVPTRFSACRSRRQGLRRRGGSPALPVCRWRQCGRAADPVLQRAERRGARRQQRRPAGVHARAGGRGELRRGAALGRRDLPRCPHPGCNDRGLSTVLGDEGGFVPESPVQRGGPRAPARPAIEAAGYTPGDEIAPRAQHRRVRVLPRDGRYVLAGEGADYSSTEWADPPGPPCATGIRSCRSRTAWPKTTGTVGSRSPERLGGRVQLVGDDLFVTNVDRIQEGIERGVANSVLIKVNQIGTLSETLDAIQLVLARLNTQMMSHRSGDTEDTTIADLAVATNCGQLKSGAPAVE